MDHRSGCLRGGGTLCNSGNDLQRKPPQVTWIPDEDWNRIQRLLPIVVVDLALLSRENPPKAGLIQRETPHQGIRWNLIGGRIEYGETLDDAVLRQVRLTLGENITIDAPDASRPHYVAQYAPIQRPQFSFDPRKHAVGLTYAVTAHGDARPDGEALSFSWFELQSLPPRDQWGFQQDRVAENCYRNAGFNVTFSS